MSANQLLEAFNQAQEGGKGMQVNTALYKQVHSSLQSEDEQTRSSSYEAVTACVELLVQAERGSASEQNSQRFVLGLLHHALQEGDSVFPAYILERLADLSQAEDKEVRLAVCSLLSVALQQLSRLELPLDEVFDSPSTLQELASALAGRLGDKLAAVRIEAARGLGALTNLEAAAELSSLVTDALLEALALEKQKDVRRALVGALPLAEPSLGLLLERTLDQSPEVRGDLYSRLQEPSAFGALSPAQRVLLLERGMKDRSAAVSSAASQMLGSWLTEGCGGDLAALLAALDPASHEEVALLALQDLVQQKTLQPLRWAQQAAAEGRLQALCEGSAEGVATGEQGDGGLLGHTEALLLRFMCCWLQERAEEHRQAAASSSGARSRLASASADACHAALEELLPPSGDGLVAVARAHLRPGHSYAATQLLLILSASDVSDASVRLATADLLELAFRTGSWGGVQAAVRCTTVEWSPEWGGALLSLAVKVQQPRGQFLAALLVAAAEALAVAHSGAGEDAWLRLIGLTRLAIEQALEPTIGSQGRREGWHEVLATLLAASAQSSSQVRAGALSSLGALAAGVLPLSPQDLHSCTSALQSALHDDAACSDVRVAAAKAVCDLACLRGFRALDDLERSLGQPEQLSGAGQPLLEQLLRLLERESGAVGEASRELVQVLVKGMARAVQQALASSSLLTPSATVQVLSKLLVQAVASPSQVLAVSLPAFLAASRPAQASDEAPLEAPPAALVAQAAMPALRAVFRASPSPTGHLLASSLLSHIANLLQGALEAAGEANRAAWALPLARDLLTEALVHSKAKSPPQKAYLSSLLDLASLATNQDTSPQQVSELLVVEELAKRCANVGSVGHSTAQDIASYAAGQLRAHGKEQVLRPEDLAELLASLEAYKGAAAEEAGAPAPSTVKKGAKGRPSQVRSRKSHDVENCSPNAAGVQASGA